MSARLPPAIFLMGPTAAGKTDLALALARALPCELISVDSALVYRDMDIGTAKPSKAVLAQYPHQLIDIRDPAQTYSGKLLNQLLATQQDNGRVLLQLSAQYRQQLQQQPYQYYNQQQFTDAAALSIQAQQQIERQDSLSFEQYIAEYYAEVPACDKTLL